MAPVFGICTLPSNRLPLYQQKKLKLSAFPVSIFQGGNKIVNLDYGSFLGSRSSKFGLKKYQVARASVKVSSEGKKVDIKSVSVVLLAGGVGKRMGASIPKQYLPIFDQPIALYSFFTFANLEEVGEIVVVCDPSFRHLFEEAKEKINVPVKFALPGKERQDSVFSGLQEIQEGASLVAVHDSARPLVTKDDIRKVIQDAVEHGAAVLGVPSKATIKEAGSDLFVTKTLDRSLLWEMQTPQVIEPELLKKGFNYVQQENLEVTDDVSIVEHLKHPVKITPGSYTNIKVTTPDDLLVAERILSEIKV